MSTADGHRHKKHSHDRDRDDDRDRDYDRDRRSHARHDSHDRDDDRERDDDVADDKPAGKRGKKKKVKKTKKSHPIRNLMLAMLVLLIATVCLAPTIISNTALRNWAVETALGMNGSARLGATSLSWLSEGRVEDLEIYDASGELVLKAALITAEKPLLWMLLDLSDLGRIRVVRPAAHLVCDERSSNFEQVFRGVLAGSPDAAPASHNAQPSAFSAKLEITEGSLTIDDQVSERRFQVDGLTLDCTLADAIDGTILVAAGKLNHERMPGNFHVELRVPPSGGGKVDCQAAAMPLELVQPFARRAARGASLAGMLTADLHGAWGPMAQGGDTSINGQASIDGLKFTADALQGEKIELAQLTVPCRMSMQGEYLRIEQLSLNCDLGKADLTGAVRTSVLSAPDRLAALARENYKLTGSLDLAKLARMLPDTLQIRQGTEITSGQVEWAINGGQDRAGMAWSGHIGSNHLAARANGRQFVWQNPLSIDFSAQETPKGIVLEQASCKSSFLTAEGSGTLDDLTIRAGFDLARLVSKLRQFSDLGGVTLNGQGELSANVKRADGQPFLAAALFKAEGFECTLPGSQPWREAEVTAALKMQGQMQDAQLASITAASLTLGAGGETVQIDLEQPVNDPLQAVWPLKCSWSGDLAKWAPRLETGLGLAGWYLSGTGSLSATLSASPSVVIVESAKLRLSKLQAVGNDIFLIEPEITLDAQARCDFEHGRIEIANGQLLAGASNIVLTKAVATRSVSGWTVTDAAGRIDADLAQVYRWNHDPRVRADFQVSGHLAINAQVQQLQNAIAAQIEGGIQNLEVIDRSNPQPGVAPTAWRERQVTLAARGTYHTAREQLELTGLQVASSSGALQCNAAGKIALAKADRHIDVSGDLKYDWQNLAALWKPLVGDGIQISGQQDQKFRVFGLVDGEWSDPQSWKRVTGEAAVGWQAIDLYGLPVGPGELSAQLAEGWIRTRPLDVAVSSGRLTLNPTIRLNPGPVEFIVPQGKVLTGVHLSPELCKKEMKMVAPILANTTEAEGRFSLEMAGGRIPLADPAGGDFRGRMAIDARAEPGPVAKQFVVLFKELSTLLGSGSLARLDQNSGAIVTIDSGNVDFCLFERRIFHQNLVFNVGTMQIRTRGSVGFDNTLYLMAEIPLHAKLLGLELSGGALEGKSISVPINGTLDDPKLDQRELQRAVGKLLEDTAKGVLIDGVGKQLERLLPIR